MVRRLRKKLTLTVKICEPYPDDERVFRITTEEDASGVNAGDLIENLSGNADVTVRNCEFGRFRGTMRIQTRGKGADRELLVREQRRQRDLHRRLGLLV